MTVVFENPGLVMLGSGHRLQPRRIDVSGGLGMAVFGGNTRVPLSPDLLYEGSGGKEIDSLPAVPVIHAGHVAWVVVHATHGKSNPMIFLPPWATVSAEATAEAAELEAAAAAERQVAREAAAVATAAAREADRSAREERLAGAAAEFLALLAADNAGLPAAMAAARQVGIPVPPWARRMSGAARQEWRDTLRMMADAGRQPYRQSDAARWAVKTMAGRAGKHE